MSDRLDVRKTYKLFIGGAFPRSESGRTYEVADAKGRFLANASKASRKDGRDAVSAARKAFGGWSKRTPYNRGQILYRVAEMLEGRREQFVAEVAAAEGLERSAAEAQVDLSIDRLVWYAGWADKVAQVSGIIREIIEAEADVRFDRGHFFAFGPSSLDFEVVYYLLKPDYNFYMDVQERINLGLVRRLTELGIAFALPMQRVYMDGAGLQPVRHLHPQSGEAVAAQPASQPGQPWGQQEGQQGNEGGDGQPSSPPSLIMPTGR